VAGLHSARARRFRAALTSALAAWPHERQENDGLGLLTGRRDGRVAMLEVVAQPGGADPTGDGPAAASEDGSEEQQGEPRGGTPVEGGGEAGEPLARGGERMRGCHGWLRPG
jgi:hypothetical protein